MNNIVKLSSLAAVIAVVSLGALAGCSAADTATVEYRVTSTASQVGTVTYHTVQPGAGGVDFEDVVRKQSWSRKVDGGKSPKIAVTAPAHGTVTCEIRDADGKVLVREHGKDGEATTCAAGE